MKKTLLAGGLAALAIAAAGGVAVAQQSPERPHARGLRADANADQRLSQAEFVGARVDRLAAADADRDGSVTPDEMRAAAQARHAQRADARFDRLDADNDGSISKAEFEARREARAERGPRPERAYRGPGRRAGRAERAETRGPIVIAEARTRAEAAFARLDADSDGFITTAERQAAHADRRERMSERREARRAQQASPSAPASE
ncbi:MAG: EF-hand domain-containing protein [Brevundimonas sp.]|uniref:EF-hand domain-containing protein n=1 Tax=Brevundimonas sp. TaxID=1871086 RepID=UPI0039193542